MINDTDGYYYTISSKWAGQIAVLKDASAHLREIYSYDSASGMPGNMLVSFMTVKKSDWDEGKYKNKGYSEITHDGISSYLCKIGKGAGEEITEEDVRKNFKLID